MPQGFSKKVLDKLWEMFNGLRSGTSRKDMISGLFNGNSRQFCFYMTKLRHAGFRITHSRTSDTYSVENWPENRTFSFRFDERDFFLLMCFLSEIGGSSLRNRLAMALSDETEAVFDTGPAYGIANNITSDLEDVFASLKEAITNRRKTIITYKTLSDLPPATRTVHPYKLVHTPVSWYLVAYCESRKEYRKFKLARISDISSVGEKFRRRKDFDMQKIIGDAWWIRSDPDSKPMHIEVLFTGDAAQSIREYRFHRSQKMQPHPNGTLASWELSSLEEFSSWLLQWLPEFKILQPDTLESTIRLRVAKYQIRDKIPKEMLK